MQVKQLQVCQLRSVSDAVTVCVQLVHNALQPTEQRLESSIVSYCFAYR